MTYRWDAGVHVPIAGPRAESVGTRLLVLLVPLWLVGLIFPPVVTPEGFETMQLIALVWLFPISLLVGREYFLYSSMLRHETAIRLWMFLFLCAALLSAMVSEYPLLSTAHVFATAIGVLYCSGLWSCVKDRMRQCLSLYAVSGSLIVGCVYLIRPLHQGRLTWNATSQPNHLAIIAFGVLMAALVIRSRWLSTSLVVINLLVIIAAEGRGSLLASLLTLGVFAVLREVRSKNRRGVARMVGLTVLAFALALAFQHEVTAAIERLLLLYDPTRGLHTGFTGRVHSWNDAFGLFLTKPFLGVGYRLHTLYGSAHSGYLALLAEVGLVGTSCAMVLTALVATRLWKMAVRGDEMSIVGLSAAAGYMFLAVFEGLFINTGLPTSMLVWIFFLMPNRRSVTTVMVPDRSRGRRQAWGQREVATG